LEPAYIHHIISFLGDDVHDVTGLTEVVYLSLIPNPFRVLVNVFQEELVLHDPLNGLDEQIT
jgi:hypothetical protein